VSQPSWQLRNYTGDTITPNLESSEHVADCGGRFIEILARGRTRLKECGRTFGLGQTMTEYAMIVACVAIVVIVGYELLGQDINAMGSWHSIDKDLTGQ